MEVFLSLTFCQCLEVFTKYELRRIYQPGVAFSRLTVQHRSGLNSFYWESEVKVGENDRQKDILA